MRAAGHTDSTLIVLHHVKHCDVFEQEIILVGLLYPRCQLSGREKKLKLSLITAIVDMIFPAMLHQLKSSLPSWGFSLHIEQGNRYLSLRPSTREPCCHWYEPLFFSSLTRLHDNFMLYFPLG